MIGKIKTEPDLNNMKMATEDNKYYMKKCVGGLYYTSKRVVGYHPQCDGCSMQFECMEYADSLFRNSIKK